MGHFVRYCLDCEWMIRDDEHEEPASHMIEHAIETGHDLDSDDRSNERPCARSSE